MTVESISVTASFEWLLRGDSSLVVMTGLDTSGCNEFRWRRCWPAKRFDESADLDGGGGRKSGRLVKSCALGVPVVVDVW